MSIDAFLADLFGPGAGQATPTAGVVMPEAAGQLDELYGRGVGADNMRAFTDPTYGQQRDRQIDGAINEISPDALVPRNFDAPAVREPFQGAGVDEFSAARRMSPTAALLSSGEPVPLPRPRPMEAGPGGSDLNMTPPPRINPMPPPAAASMPPPDLLTRLSGRNMPTDMTMPGTVGSGGGGDAQGLMSRLMGLDQGGEKRLRSSIAGGFAGANTAFGGGSLMKGIGGGISGGLASDKDDEAKGLAAEDRTVKQANFNRQQDDKELTSDALRKLYGARGSALETNATTKANAPVKNAAWNKPPHERYKDAMHLIQQERKAIYGQINPLTSKADQAAAKAEADKQLEEFKQRTFKTYGIDQNGNETTPSQGGTPSTKNAVGTKEGEESGIYESGSISNAREAIARGANPDQVKQHLKENGIKFSDSDLAL